jgi:hypothetical protein
MAVMAVPPFVLKVIVTFAIDEDDDGVDEDELGVTDDVEELEEGVALLDDDGVEEDELDDEVVVELLELELELGVTDDAVEDELEVTDDSEELEDGVVVELEEVSIGVEVVGTVFDVGGRLELEEEFDNVINPRTPIAVTITDPPINQNQKGFLRFLSVSSTTSMTFSMMVLSSFMVNISFKDC